MRHLLIIALLVSFAACKNAQQNQASDKVSTPEVQEGWNSVESEGGAYKLYFQNINDVANPRLEKKFYLTDADGNKIYESSTYGGYVKWLDATKLEYFSPPGVMPPDKEKDDLVMIYDIEKETSYPKSQLSE